VEIQIPTYLVLRGSTAPARPQLAGSSKGSARTVGGAGKKTVAKGGKKKTKKRVAAN
jgi:hypothetical protein